MQKDLFQKDRNPMDVINEAVEKYRPSHVFGLFSDGHDSLAACHIASKHPQFSGCIHLNTGIGVEETRVFVRDTCKSIGWPLKEYYPPVSFEEIVEEYGFPGPGQHGRMYVRLKERCLRQVIKEHKQGYRGRIVFISGARRHESSRRMSNSTDYIRRDGCAVWVNPILDFTARDKKQYLAENNLPQNPVVKKLCMSGECLCGAFAQPGEIDIIRGFYPKAAQEIDRIAAKLKAAGKHHVWGTPPPCSKKQDFRQQDLFTPMCHSCEAKFYDSETIQNNQPENVPGNQYGVT